MKIPIPDDLRQSIAAALEQLDAEQSAAAGARAELTGKISAYETEQGQLAAEIATLKGQILLVPGVENKIPPLQLRAEALAGALAELRRKLDTVSPASLWHARRVFTQVAQHWQETFPEIFADQVADSFVSRQNAINVSRLADVVRILTPLRTQVEDTRFSDESREKVIRGVLKRALTGRPYLGLDMPLDVPETEAT